MEGSSCSPIPLSDEMFSFGDLISLIGLFWLFYIWSCLFASIFYLKLEAKADSIPITCFLIIIYLSNRCRIAESIFCRASRLIGVGDFFRCGSYSSIIRGGWLRRALFFFFSSLVGLWLTVLASLRSLRNLGLLLWKFSWKVWTRLLSTFNFSRNEADWLFWGAFA